MDLGAALDIFSWKSKNGYYNEYTRAFHNRYSGDKYLWKRFKKKKINRYYGAPTIENNKNDLDNQLSFLSHATEHQKMITKNDQLYKELLKKSLITYLDQQTHDILSYEPDNQCIKLNNYDEKKLNILSFEPDSNEF